MDLGDLFVTKLMKDAVVLVKLDHLPTYPLGIWCVVHVVWRYFSYSCFVCFLKFVIALFVFFAVFSVCLTLDHLNSSIMKSCGFISYMLARIVPINMR